MHVRIGDLLFSGAPTTIITDLRKRQLLHQARAYRRVKRSGVDQEIEWPMPVNLDMDEYAIVDD